MIEISPGIYRGVSFSDYCDWDAINHSKLQRIDKSPLHCQSMQSLEKSPAIRLGQLVHCGKLEPDSVDARYAVMPQYELSPDNVDAKGNPSTSVATVWCKGKRSAFAYAANQMKKTIISQSEYNQFADCMNAMLDNDYVTEIINAGESEVSIVWIDPETGLKCKARLDCVADIIMDLKTSRDDGDRPLPESFEWSMWSYNYYSQAAFYRNGWYEISGELLPFMFAVVSTTPPIQCVSAPVGEMTMELGRKKNIERLKRYAECKAAGVWPGYSSPEIFELPDRYFPDEVM